MKPTIIIRDAIKDDVKSLEELIEIGYRKEESNKGWTSEFALLSGDRLQEGEIAAALVDTKNKFFIAEDNGKVIGVVCVSKDGDWIEFGKFSVSPDYQGQGIGKALIKRVEQFVRDIWGADKLKLSVITIRSELVDFYSRYGFKDTGERIDFVKIHPYVNLKDDIKDLEVMIMEKAV